MPPHCNAMSRAMAVYFRVCCVVNRAGNVIAMKTATPHSLLVIAVVEDNPADVSIISQVLHAHGLSYVLQVLESSQRALHFFDRLAAQDGGGCPDLLLLDYTLPGLDMRELLQWIKAMPVCRRLRIIVMTGSDDPAIEAEAMALGADAFFQKPVGFQRFLALGDLIKVVMFGHTQA
jgi:two-component system, chemotaxis family, response regulator Rcp1